MPVCVCVCVNLRMSLSWMGKRKRMIRTRRSSLNLSPDGAELFQLFFQMPFFFGYLLLFLYGALSAAAPPPPCVRVRFCLVPSGAGLSNVPAAIVHPRTRRSRSAPVLITVPDFAVERRSARPGAEAAPVGRPIAGRKSKSCLPLRGASSPLPWGITSSIALKFRRVILLFFFDCPSPVFIREWDVLCERHCSLFVLFFSLKMERESVLRILSRVYCKRYLPSLFLSLLA